LHAAENGFDCELDGGRGLAFRCGKPNQDHLPPSSSPSSREFARKSPWKPPSAADAAGQAGGRYKIRTEPPRRHGMEIYAVGPLDQGNADGIRTTPPRYSAKITHKLWGRTEKNCRAFVSNAGPLGCRNAGLIPFPRPRSPFHDCRGVGQDV
jgi:hypothetical protein